MSPQEQQTALQDLRESKRLELLVCEPQDIRRPLRPQKARDCMRVGNLWSMAVYDVYGRSKDSSHILLQISTFCIFSTFLPVDFDIFDLPWPSFSNPSIWLWHLWLPGELVSILCTSYVVWLCVYSTFVCFVHGWRSKGNRFTDVYRCLQFTVWLYFGANGMCVCVFHDSVALRRLA